MDQAMLWVKRFIEERNPIATKLKKEFHFRRLFWHCWRTWSWARRIGAAEGGGGPAVELAALFHDAGKCVDNTREGHAVEGAKLCREYLASRGFEVDTVDLAAQLVADHIRPPLSTEAKILKDADILDETGALTVVWDAMAEGSRERQSYLATLERIETTLDDLRDGGLDAFSTATGKALFEKRLAFLEHFVAQLADELAIEDIPPNLRGQMRDT